MSRDKYTERELRQLVSYLTYVGGGNTKPQEIKLLADCYIELLQDCWVKIYSPQRAVPPTPTTFMLNGVTVMPCTNTSSTITNWDDILKEYGELLVKAIPARNLGGYTAVDIGPWRYAVPLPQVFPYTPWRPTIAANPIPVTTSAPPPAVASAVSEPACICSSRALVTVGHEQGCRWLLWKRAGGMQ